jgi:hypothetical protein
MNLPQDFFKTQVSVKWNSAGAGNFYITTLPTATNGFLVISPLSDIRREIIKYTGKGTDGNGHYVTVADVADRGLGGTTAQTHEIGEPVRSNITSLHWQELQDAVDQVVAGGAEDATTSQKGIVKMSVAPESATEPIAVGDNDPRVNAEDAPEAYVTESAGSGDEGKGVLLDGDGKLDDSLLDKKAPIIRQYDLSGSPHTWTKPAGLTYVDVQLWAGGGSGGSSTGTFSAAGGGGGAYIRGSFLAGSLGATETVTIGAGGAAVTGGGSTNGNVGGNSSFGSKLTIYGGGGGRGTTGSGGGGGGTQSAGATASTGGNPLPSTTSTFGGGNGGGDAVGGSSVYGGGGGSDGDRVGGASVYGGGGGGGGTPGPGAGGVSVFGGNGGAGADSGTAVSGTVPSGGGGGCRNSGTSGAGAAGRCIVTEYYN